MQCYPKNEKMKTLLTFLAFIFCNCIYSQNCNCETFIKIDYIKDIKVYSKPKGKLIFKVKNDTLKEDFVSLTILKKSLSYYYVSLINEQVGKERKGWIKKSEPIAIYARNYGDTELNLYEKPNVDSKVKFKIEKWYNDMFEVLNCENKWLYVKLKTEDKIYEGWLEKNMQCSNQYTTCN